MWVRVWGVWVGVGVRARTYVLPAPSDSTASHRACAPTAGPLRSPPCRTGSAEDECTGHWPSGSPADLTGGSTMAAKSLYTAPELWRGAREEDRSGICP